MSTPTALTVAENTNKKKLFLKSSDGETFEVEEAEVIQSQTVKDMIEDIGSDGSIPLPNVTSKILAKVIEYCKFHAGNAVEDSGLSFKSNQSEEDVKSKWDKDFVKGIEDDQEVLFDVILAANYLNIKGLLDLTCKHVADMIKGKTPEQIREKFHIKNDYTQEEEDEVRRENQWAFE